jgi:hypothetical protein
MLFVRSIICSIIWLVHRQSLVSCGAAQHNDVGQHERALLCLHRTGCTVHKLANPLCTAGLQSEAATINSFARNDASDVHRHGVRLRGAMGNKNQMGRETAGRLLGVPRCTLCAPQGCGSRRRWRGGRERKLSPRGARFVLRPQNKAAKSGSFSWSRKKRRRKNKSKSKSKFET